MCLKSEYEAWRNGDMIYDSYTEKLITADELREFVNLNKWYEDLREKVSGLTDRELLEFIAEAEGSRFQSHEVWPNSDFEDYYEEYTTPNGEAIVAFGEFGYDG
jgi:hypothetical protein